MMSSVSVSLDSNPVWFEGRDLVDYGVRKLDGREEDVFRRYFCEQNTMGEIAEVYGVTRSRVHQIVKRVRGKVKKRIDGRWKRSSD